MSTMPAVNRSRTVAAFVFAATLSLASAVQADRGEPPLIRACVNKESGALRIAGPAVTCHANESPAVWRSAEPSAVSNAQKLYISTQDYFAENRITRFLETTLPAGTYLVIAKGSMTSAAYGSCEIVSGPENFQTYHNGSSFDNNTKSLAQIMIAKVTLVSSANVAMRCGNGFGVAWNMTQPVLMAMPVATDKE